MLDDKVIQYHFDLYDQNGDGEISITEIGGALEQMKVPLQEKSV